MRGRVHYVVSLFSIVLFLSSCNSKGPTGPEGPKLKGDILGYVILVDADGSQPSNRGNVTVAVDGAGISTQTDVMGKFVLSSIETGTYTITYSKSGYGSSKTVQYQFVGGGQALITNVFLCQPPSFKVSSLSALPSSNSVTLTATLSEPVNGQRRVFLFFGRSSEVSSNPANYEYSTSFSQTFTNGSYTFGYAWTTTFRPAGFPSGSTVYIVAYGANEGFYNSGYVDASTGHFIYSNLSAVASNIVSVTVP